VGGKLTKEERRVYYEKNKDKLLEKNKLWRQNNRDKIRANKREYESQPHRREWKKLKSKQEYLLKRELRCYQQRIRRQERKKFLDDIALSYGCQNPDCKWQGEFDPCQVTFHHFDPSQKEIEVAKMHSWSFGKIVEEVNKCICLCRNCHPLADRGLLVINELNLCKVNLDGRIM
jgi:hypothetical protein